MMMMETDADDDQVDENVVVEEFPSPPLYYQLFHDLHTISMPSIPTTIPLTKTTTAATTLNTTTTTTTTTTNTITTTETSVAENLECGLHGAIEFNPYLVAYNGRFAHVKENQWKYDIQKDYKLELKLLLRKAMEHALKLMSYYDPNRINVELITVDLRNALLDFHKLLNEYREHEGRELILQTMKDRLDDMKHVEDDLQQ